MFKYSGILLAIVLLSACARLTQFHHETSASTPTDSPVADTVQSGEAATLPMSPLDPNQPKALTDLPDVWERIRLQSRIQVPDRPDVRRELAFFATKQKFFNEVTARAEPYLYFIVTELERRRMPIELALLPIVESAFNPAAQGAGPAGLWQMVPQTARNFGLKVQTGYDGRKDAVSSTLAVLDYLQHLHDTLGNDWLNAVAAYNSGEGRIQSAIERNKVRGQATDYWSLHIPARFVQTMPKWLAMISLIKEPERYQLTLPPIANSAAIGVSRIAGSSDLLQAAQLAGISAQELKILNPAFRQGVTPPGSEYPLVLPLASVLQFEQQKHQLKKVAYVQTAPVQASKRSYTVKSGDSLGSIAARMNTSVKTLRQLNQLKSEKLKAGQKLQLPDDQIKQSVAKATPGRKPQTYQVKSGENLWTIAQKLRIDSEELRLFNKLKADTHLQPGQILKVPGSKTEKIQPSSATSASVARHKVIKGDSLDRIARKYKIKLVDLLKWNQLQADSKLKPGQLLYLAPRRQS